MNVQTEEFIKILTRYKEFNVMKCFPIRLCGLDSGFNAL
jgi:hypothetical protein